MTETLTSSTAAAVADAQSALATARGDLDQAHADIRIGRPVTAVRTAYLRAVLDAAQAHLDAATHRHAETLTDHEGDHDD